MKTSMHRSAPHAAILLVTSALFCSLPGLLPAEEALSTTAQRLAETTGQEDAATAAAEISAKFTAFAGSSANATALITGLSNGSTITLTTTAADGTVTTTSFQPATGKLGYGSTFISLALAQESLAKAGITQPTPAQIKAALNGGSITGSNGTAVSLTGVLTLRAGGQTWGDIAQTLGVKLGHVVSDLHAANERAEIASKFTTFAGSSSNATALITGLRNCSTITLTTTAADGTVTTTSFQPATGKLGYGSAFISLTLAQESLAKAGITQPIPAQIEAALNGGSVTGSNGTAVSLAGVLTLRAGGKGWGDIAQTLGVKLGRAVSDLRDASERAESPGKPDFAGKSAQMTAKSETAGRPDWAGTHGMGHAAMMPPPPPAPPGRH
jgi:hypothetical protein